MIPLIQRDITLAFRSGGGFALALAFFLIIVMFVPFGIGADRVLLSKIAPGILWIGALLSCLLSLDRIFQLDFEDGSLDALATAPLPLSSTVFAKSTAHWITTGLPLSLIAAPYGYLLGLPNTAYIALVFSLLLGTPALSFIGGFAAAVTVGVKRGGLLLSLLVLPLYIPTLILGAQTVLLASRSQDFTAGLAICAAISLACIATMPFAAAMALRASLR